MASPLAGVRSTLSGIQWPSLVEGPAATVLAIARELEDTQWLDAGALRARQFAQLARVAPWLSSHSPAFARRLVSAGLAADEFGTGNLVIYPNALRTLIDASEARGERLERLKAIRTVGEMVGDRLRQRTRDVLGIEIADAYTCQEAGYLALQCPESGLYHLMAESLIVEVLRPDGTACDEGEIGRIVVTDIHNHATPVVRYALGDHAEAGGPCVCGRGLPTLRRIVGRSRNLIRLPDGDRVWPSLGGFGPEGYLHVLPILQFQLLQTELDLLEVRLVTERPLTASEERLIVERTRRSLGHPFRLEFRYFEGRLPLPDSGKFEDFICLV